MSIRIISLTFTVTILLLLFFSCQQTPDNITLALSQVESCMESAPDSALTLLNQIPEPEILKGKAQADYALLMTQAMDKNYIAPSSDSLILLAVGYYGSHSEDIKKKGKSFFYYGRVLDGLKRDEDAMKYYLSAKEQFDDTREYKILGLISEEMGNLNWRQDMYETALANYKDSRKYFILAKDFRSISFALRNIGRTYLSEGKSDSANIYYREALQTAHAHKCPSEITILQELGLLHRVKQDYKKAEYYLLKALDVDLKSQVRYEISLSLGYTYLQLDDDVEAEKYLKWALGSSKTLTQIDAYNTLFRLGKSKGNLLSAIRYKEKADSLHLIANDQQARNTAAELQKKYENEKLQKENLEIKMGYKNVILLSLILLFAIVLLACYYTYRYRTAKRKIREIEHTIRENEEEINFCQQDIADYKKLRFESEEHKIELVTEIAKLDGKVSVLSKHNKDLARKLREMGEETSVPALDSNNEELYVTAFHIYLSMRHGVFHSDISNRDWERFFKLFDLLYAGFVERLRTEFPQLTKHDFEICCLLKIGLSNEELAKVFSTTSDSTTKAKGRLKKRLNLSPDDVLETFICSY